MATERDALVQVFDEFFWILRREGFLISTAQAVDAARAVAAVGLRRRADVREAIACVVVSRPRDRARFDAVFDAFFSPDPMATKRTLWDRLQARGFSPAELDALRSLLVDLAGSFPSGGPASFEILDRGAELDRLLALSGMAAAIDAHSGSTVGFLAHRLTSKLGAARVRRSLGILRLQLSAALGDRGQELADALTHELDRAEEEIRAFVRHTHDVRVAELDFERVHRRAETAPFASLPDAQMDDVRRAVRRLAERLRGAARVRARHARRRGRIDPHRTLRRAFRTGGVPYALARRERRRDRTKVMILCDVSDSVRAAALFLLEFTYAAQELFARARTFVFVSELRETTQLFARKPLRAAIESAWRGGAVVRAGDNSNYGRVLRTFEARHLSEVDRATTVVILGDGRTNYHDAATGVLDHIRDRSRALVWLCPEPRGKWTEGDSAMVRYAARCSAVLEVRCARDLENAARTLLSLR